MSRALRRTGYLAILGAALLCARPAAAVCDKPLVDEPLNSITLSGGTLSPAGSHPSDAVTVVAAGTTISVLKTHTMVENCHATLDGTVQNSPTPVQLDDGSYAVFVATMAGSVYRINPANCRWDAGNGWVRSYRRAACANDTLQSPPIVHLRRYATNDFANLWYDDIVYVATRYVDTGSCTGATSANRIYAVRATDGFPVWIFNETPSVVSTYYVDGFMAAGYLDLARNQLFIGTTRASGSQHTLFAIDLITGTRAWSANLGAIEAAPMLVDNRIYVGTKTGYLKAVAREGGGVAWSQAVGSPVSKNIYVERRAPYTKLIGVVGNDGLVRLFRDDLVSGVPAGVKVWEAAPGSTTASSRVAFDPDGGKLYVGGADGFLYQMRLADGVTDIYRKVSSGFAVGDPSFVFEDTNGDGTFDDVRLIVGASNGTIAKYCSPWAATASLIGGNRNRTCSVDGDCLGLQCATGACVAGVCTTRPVPDGTGCNDGNANTGTPLAPADSCLGGTCKGLSQCESNFTVCTCRESNGNNYARTITLTNNNESVFTTNNACLTAATGARSAVYIHLVDDQGRPFPGITGTNLKFSLDATGGPEWHDPVTDSVIQGASVTLTSGIKETNQKGTYFAVLGAPTAMPTQTSYTITALVTWCGFQRSFATTLRVEQTQGGSTGLNISGCKLLNAAGEAHHLKVLALYEDTGGVASGVAVMVGYSKSKPFFSSFGRFVDPAHLAGDVSNVKYTDTYGVAEFIDYGDGLNGPFVVTVGPNSSGTQPYAHVTVQGIGASNAVISLPHSQRPAIADPVYTAGTVGSLTTGRQRKLESTSTPAMTRMALVSQRRKLDFYAAMDPAALVDSKTCGGTPQRECGLNAFIAGVGPTPPPLTTPERDWSKTFNYRTGDTLQASYHSVPTDTVFPLNGNNVRVFDLRAYLLNATFEQLGFRFAEDVTGNKSGVDIPLGQLAPPASLTLNYLNASINGSRRYWDIVGMTLTDYDAAAATGRGGGDIFLQAHAAKPFSTLNVTIAVPFFNLDDPTLDNQGSIGAETTWPIGMVSGMYLMNQPCGQAGEDPRCAITHAARVTPAMRTGRTSYLVRYDTSTSCGPPWAQANVTRTLPTHSIPDILDLKYDPSYGSGFYQACQDGAYADDGTCCQGDLVGGVCTLLAYSRPGDFMTNAIQVRTTDWGKMGAVPTCPVDRQPVSRISYPFWVFHTPGNGAAIFVPSLPKEFFNACNSVDGSAPPCLVDQRPGLPQRMGGTACTSDANCKPGTETCRYVDGASICLSKDSYGYFWAQEYVWHADLHSLGLITDPCKIHTPCTETVTPVSNPTAKIGQFDGAINFHSTVTCATAQSSNWMIVN